MQGFLLGLAAVLALAVLSPEGPTKVVRVNLAFAIAVGVLVACAVWVG
jgi:hypothetical protein